MTEGSPITALEEIAAFQAARRQTVYDYAYRLAHQGFARTVPAAQVPLLASLHYDGQWRIVEGVSIDVTHAIVSVRFQGWGAVVDFPATDAVTIRGPGMP